MNNGNSSIDEADKLIVQKAHNKIVKMYKGILDIGYYIAVGGDMDWEQHTHYLGDGDEDEER